MAKKESPKYRILKLGLSAGILFHLVAIAYSPNSETELGTFLNPLFQSYLHFFEFTTSWSFFAPDPGSFLVYFEWELLGKQGEQLELGQFPDLVAESAGDSNFLLKQEQDMRKLSVSRFMAAYDARAEKMLIPYLCFSSSRQGTSSFHHQGTPSLRQGAPLLEAVDSVRLWKVIELIPPLKEIALGHRKIEDARGRERHWITHAYCKDLEL